MTMNCAEADTFLHAYVDGELAGADRQAYEIHLRSCEHCTHASRFQARFKAAVRGHLPRPELPLGLRTRLASALAAAPAPRRRWPWQSHPRSFTVATAAAAALVLFMANGQRPVRSSVMQQAFTTFRHDMPLEVLSDSCTKVSDWFRGKVDFTLQPGAMLGGTRCQGGRLVNVSDRLAAYVVYQAPAGHRLGLMVVRSDSEPLAGTRQRVLHGGRRAFIDHQRGVSMVTVREPSGLDYVFTADLDEDALANWVDSAYLSQR
jgi:anti-sigma factor RsiW